MDHHNGDASDDMDMSDDEAVVIVPDQQGSKRRIEDTADDTPMKKRRTEGGRDVSTIIPDPVWQRIFLQLSPAMLFRCMRVNRRFKRLLDNTKGVLARGRGRPAAQLIDSESIWMCSRRITYGTLPRPLAGFSEAQMLRLITQQTCQNCHQKFAKVKATNALNGGPGPNGVRTIWPFRTSVCGHCLRLLCLTDVDLLQERRELPTGALRRGLPFALVTKDNHIVSEQAARQNSGASIQKIFWKPDVDNIMVEYNEAKQLGDGAAEEWVKGLDDMGKSSLNDALRWSRWEEQLPLGTHLATYMRDLDPVSFPKQKPVQAAALTYPLPRPVHAASLPKETLQPHAPNTVAPLAAPKPVRDAREAQEIRRLRAEDIQRRCLQLHPPLQPEVLPYMEAYNAALQISMPMTDAMWETLLPRLERERDRAEQVHYQRSQQLAVFSAIAPAYSHAQSLVQNKDADREWEVVRLPLRKKLAEYADDIINGKWLRAASLDVSSAPFFAVEVLMHVYKCHNEKPDAEPLLLADLRWIFDHKIRQAAESQCKELFACSGCLEDNNETRWFAFEGLIQHYGAKHTDDFTYGNIVVHWQTAKWPEWPPFVTDVGKLMKREYKQGRRDDTTRRGKHGRSSAQHQEPLFRQDSFTPQEDSDEIPPAHRPSDQQDKMQLISTSAGNLWNALAGVPGLADNIRIHTVLKVTQARHVQKYEVSMSIEDFVLAIGVDPSLAELKSASRLACRFCDPQPGQGKSHYERVINKKLYNFNSLLNHFELSHKSNLSFLMQWTSLVEVPEREEVVTLMETPGMNDAKLALIAEAFPKAFPATLPRIGTVVARQPDTGLAARLVEKRLGNKAPKSKKKKGQNNANGKDATPVPKAGEYDPRNPMLSGKDAPLDLSKFDTDAQPRPTPDVAVDAFQGLTIAPETLAAINSLQTAFKPQEKVPRLPSPFVNKAVPAQSAVTSSKFDVKPEEKPGTLPSPFAKKAVLAQPASSTPVAMPDITAIISALSRRNARDQVTNTPQGYAQANATPQGYPQANATPQGYSQANTTAQGHAQINATPQTYAQINATPQGYAQVNATPQGYAQVNAIPQAYPRANTASQGYAPSNEQASPPTYDAYPRQSSPYAEYTRQTPGQYAPQTYSQPTPAAYTPHTYPSYAPQPAYTPPQYAQHPADPAYPAAQYSAAPTYAPAQHAVGGYAQPSYAAYHAAPWHSQQLSAAQHPSPAPSGGEDLLAALRQNSRAYQGAAQAQQYARPPVHGAQAIVFPEGHDPSGEQYIIDQQGRRLRLVPTD